MPSAPERYVDWINHNVGFNPRGQTHSDALTHAIFADLQERCLLIGEGFKRHLELRTNVGLNGKRNVSRTVARAADEEDDDELEPNIDGVLLSSGLGSAGRVTPVTLENKTIMTAHGKARTNRYNDARAYASHVHNSSPATVAAFTIIVNTALVYRNPDAFARNAASSGVNPPAAAQRTVDLFTANMRLRNDAGEQPGRCEAVLILAINYDGVNPTARLVTEPPAPGKDSRFSYDGFVTRICDLFAARFGGTG
jgi:hypothetical protein